MAVNKSDILNSAVPWTSDLMWALYQKYLQEDQLMEYVRALGGTWPFPVADDEQRMRSELIDAVEKNDPNAFAYSRTDAFLPSLDLLT